MISVQKAIFPGFALGCLFLVYITSLIANPQIALAYTQPAVAAGIIPVQEEGGAARQEEPVAEQPPVVEEVMIAEQTQQESEPAAVADCTLSTSYPESVLKWCSLIERYAEEQGLEQSLVAAVMLQESGGNPNAYSKSGAVGLMQVMPRDGLASSFMCINGPCFADRPSAKELYDPEFNIAYGAQMLAGLIRRNGNVRDALRSYGPMNMGYRYADIVLNIQARYQ